MIYKGQEVDDIRFLEASSAESLKDMVDSYAKSYEIVDLEHSVSTSHHAKIVLKKFSKRQQLNEG